MRKHIMKHGAMAGEGALVNTEDSAVCLDDNVTIGKPERMVTLAPVWRDDFKIWACHAEGRMAKKAGHLTTSALLARYSHVPERRLEVNICNSS